VRAGNKFARRSAHNIGCGTGHQGQGSFTRIGELFDLLRLDTRGKVHTIPRAWPAFSLPFNEA